MGSDVDLNFVVPRAHLIRIRDGPVSYTGIETKNAMACRSLLYTGVQDVTQVLPIVRHAGPLSHRRDHATTTAHQAHGLVEEVRGEPSRDSELGTGGNLTLQLNEPRLATARDCTRFMPI